MHLQSRFSTAAKRPQSRIVPRLCFPVPKAPRIAACETTSAPQFHTTNRFTARKPTKHVITKDDGTYHKTHRRISSTFSLDQRSHNRPIVKKKTNSSLPPEIANSQAD